MNPRQRIFWTITATYVALFGFTGSLAFLLIYLAIQPSAGVLLIWLAGMLVAATGAALGAGLLLARKLEKALFGFSGALQRAAAGNYDVSLPVESRQEFEELAAAMDQMTEHVQTHATQMQNDRDRLRMVLNSMVEGVIAVDASQRVILFNTAASRMFKLREPTSLGRPLWELVRHPRMQQWVAQALERTDPVGGEMEMLDPVARILVVNVARFPVEPLFGAVVVVGDVTELRRLERIRQEFVANASHELKTPLASIKACVETLLDGALDDPKFRTKFLQAIDEQTDRLDALVRDMLTLAQVESPDRACRRRGARTNSRQSARQCD
jgi:two-component system phosphate regulon sensor histidine kinase PhoR